MIIYHPSVGGKPKTSGYIGLGYVCVYPSCFSHEQIYWTWLYMRASVHASCFSRTDVCLEAEGISCLPLAHAQGQAKQLLLSQKKILCLPMSLQLLEYVMCVTASDSTEIFNHWMPLEKTAKV